MIRHVSTSVEGLEKLTDVQLGKMASSILVNGKPLRSAGQVRKLLAEIKDEGFLFIPADGCDNYDDQGRCLGHERRESDA